MTGTANLTEVTGTANLSEVTGTAILVVVAPRDRGFPAGKQVLKIQISATRECPLLYSLPTVEFSRDQAEIVRVGSPFPLG